MSVMIMGVHLDEPTAPVTSQWSNRLTSPVKSQWTDEDLDAFVRQLSNPQHQVTKVGGASGPKGRGATRQATVDLCHEIKDRSRFRAPLSRSETTAGPAYPSLASPTEVEPSHSKTEASSSSGGGLISSLSGLRLLKNKKLSRSSHSTVGKYIRQKSKDKEEPLPTSPTQTTSSSSVAASTSGDFSQHSGSLSAGSSSPEGSDTEASGGLPSPPPTSTDAPNGSAVKEGKKRRFRKMLSRPLNRSHSAGCAKDVPAHALFLEQQQQNETDTATRKGRASEGDIHNVKEDNEGENNHSHEVSEENVNDSTECDLDRTPSGRSHGGRIHKTKSADAAMMALEDLGTANQQQKPKSRNIAKKITRKMQFLRRRHTDSTIGMVDKDEHKRLSSIDPKEAKAWSNSFETLLYDKTALELFRGFLLSEHSDENIEFWIACENYKSTKSHKQLPALANKIYNDYVAVLSKREINLDSKTRASTQEGVANPTRQTFDEAQKRVQALMEKDSYRRFLESELYQDLIAGNLHHKS